MNKKYTKEGEQLIITQEIEIERVDIEKIKVKKQRLEDVKASLLKELENYTKKIESKMSLIDEQINELEFQKQKLEN